ncbi:GDSL-type esterase/lipase family protein [Arenibacter sp. F20364]|uniref:GDSL-type esterase/lipase family protein n=1 Tax=Arenibacter sp. F20364 TaxID=2926415 RepID=UPI001FF383A2|nr:GDSL-type esterase/lipase family protein [Arenibacter sp. F20364]MCK0190912.1 GDSL-type esterase/lipase family protein [Arenibacter sp. F20364]
MIGKRLLYVFLGLFIISESVGATVQEPIKIACVGNSITYGSQVANKEKNAYPAQLQAMLGEQYTVRNFGISGRTLLKKGDRPYWETKAYEEALQFKPDVVFIKLGTNDSKLQNRVHMADFETDYIDLINSFIETNKDARIILLLPVPAFTTDTTGIWNQVITKKIIPLTQSVANKTKSEVLDLYHLFIDQPGLLPDNVHPSSLGATVIAKRLYETVIQKEIQPLEILKSKEIKVLQTENFYGYDLTDFEYKGILCKVVKPKKGAPGAPWVLRARFWGHEPQTDIALLERGFHIAYCDVANLFGGPEAVKRWDRFYRLLTQAGLSKKVVLEGMSRGGLIVYNWAEKNPEKVACVYADAPVLDGKSWPGGLGNGKGSFADWETFKKVYDLKTEGNVSKFKGNPIHKIKSIAHGGYPMMHVCGAADGVVPIDENTKPFETGIKAFGGLIDVVYKEGVGHHPHSLENPSPIVDFILRATGKKVNFALVPAPSAEYRSAAGWKEGKDWWAQANDIDSLCLDYKEIDLLLIGNSITQGWGGNRPNVTHAPGTEAAELYFKDLRWIGAGISGDRTQHILYRLSKGNYESSRPKVAVLAIGVNNFEDNTTEEIVEGIREVLKVAKEKFTPSTKILFLGPLPTGLDLNTERREKYNKIHSIIKEFGDQKNVFYYNTIKEFSDIKGFLRTDLYSQDGIHLLPEGYKVWGRFIRDKYNAITK